MPKVIIIAGPNGAGKTTFARNYLPNEAKTIQFVNADMIAAGISPFAPSSADVAAGKTMLTRLDVLASEGLDFALETTLSGIWLKRKIIEWQSLGFQVKLFYLRLSSSELAIERVQNRVKNGGHHIPDDVVRRRFIRSQDLLERTYKDLVDDWFVYDNDCQEARLLESKWNQ